MLKHIFLTLLALTICGTEVQAALTYQGRFNPNLSMTQLFKREYPEWQQSIIYIFTNNNQCYECPQTISLIEQIYNEAYAGIYNLQVINYQEDTMYNYAETYNLTRPLEVVLARVRDGAIRGYRKLENLEDNISDVVSFRDFFENQVNEYLGN